jgi:Lrp/AsnC family leucine-responsive transcriptional regulator
MPIELTGADVAVLNALLKDGRKSFRQISRETEISTPTVKTRFNRLINTGIIKSIIPIVDFDIVSYKVKETGHKNNHVDRFNTNVINAARQSINDRKKYLDLRRAKKVTVNLNCNYCNTPLLGKMYTFKFANIERFFCCKECRLAYQKRYAARIRAITKRYIYKPNQKAL